MCVSETLRIVTYVFLKLFEILKLKKCTEKTLAGGVTDSNTAVARRMKSNVKVVEPSRIVPKGHPPCDVSSTLDS